MKSIYVAIDDSLVQISVSEPLFFEAVSKDREYNIVLDDIAPLLSKTCTYVLAVLDFEETSSAQSKRIIDGIHSKDVVIAVASLWQYNKNLSSDGDALLVVTFDEIRKRQIREARGLVTHFSLGQFDDSFEPHKKIIYDLPWSSLN